MDLSALRSRVRGTPLAPLDPLLAPAFIDGIRHGDCRRWRRLIGELPDHSPSGSDLGDVIRIGRARDIDDEDRAALRARLLAFLPWRKGPFSLFGVRIDAEWRSHLKWNRLAGAVAPLAGRTVLDAGCGNGYYGFRMAGAGARLVVGVDPHVPYAAQFWAVRRYLPEAPVFVIPAALERLPSPLPAFDTVFSMGVVYHQPSPPAHIERLRSFLRPGGQLVLESIVAPGEAGFRLVPKGRYARMAKIGAIPSTGTLLRWAERCGLENARLVDVSRTTSDEQRATEWMPFDSLEAALDPDDPGRTVEGHPAPKRAIVVCEAPG